MSVSKACQAPSSSGEGAVPGWVAGRRPRGDAPVNCLIMIIVVIVGSVWAYHHFFHDRALENAGKDIVITNSTDDSARNNYVGRMRDRHIPSVRNWGSQTRDACRQVMRGKLTGADAIESKFNQLDVRLRDLIGEVNSQSAPKEFAATHRQLAESIGNYWKAMQKTKQGASAKEADEQKRLYEEARGLLAKADTAFKSSEKAIKRVTGQK